MSAEPKTKTIDGLKVTSRPLPPSAAYDLWADLVPLLQDGMQIAKALSNTEMMLRILQSTTIQTAANTFTIADRATFDLAFAGTSFRTARLAAVFAFEVTFGNFTDAAKAFAEDIYQLTGAQDQAP